MWAIVLEETGSPMEETVNVESRCGIIRASFRVSRVVGLSWNSECNVCCKSKSISFIISLSALIKDVENMKCPGIHVGGFYVVLFLFFF